MPDEVVQPEKRPYPYPPEPIIPCAEQVTVIKVPVPEGTVNLLDPEVIARQAARGKALNEAAEIPVDSEPAQE